MLGLEDLIVANVFARRGAVEAETLRTLLRQVDQAADRVPLGRALHERLGVTVEDARALHETARRRLRQRAEERYLAVARRDPALARAPLDALAGEQAQAGYAWTVGERLLREGLLDPARHQAILDEAGRQLADDEARILQLNRAGDYAQALSRGGQTQAHGPGPGPGTGGASGPLPRGLAAPGLGSSAEARLFVSGSSQDARALLSPGPPPPGTDLRSTSSRRVVPQPAAQTDLRATASRRVAVMPDEPAGGDLTMKFPAGGAGAAAGQEDGAGERTLILPAGAAAGVATGGGMDDKTVLAPPPPRARPPQSSDGGGMDDKTVLAPPPRPRPSQGGAGVANDDKTVLAPPPRPRGGPPAGPAPSPTAFAGRRVDGKFEIVRELGRGNMGIVFLATELATGRPVALKVVQGPANADARGRFKREIMVSQRVQHPHVIEVITAGEMENGSSYMVMELLEGGSLTELIKREGALARDRALVLFEQLLRGLEAVHGAKVVHRDLKPDNVHVVTRDGREHVKIMDFGISRFLDQEVAEQQDVFVTVRGTLSGSPQYVAPEAVLDPERIETTHDVYACGVVLFEMLTGTLPFPPARTLKDILADTLNTRPRALDEANPQGAPFPPDLERFVRKLLEKDPETRPQNAMKALEVLAELKEDLAGGGGKRAKKRTTTRQAAAESSGFTARLLRKITSIFRKAEPEEEAQ
jgi:hypothetical protein